MMTTADDIERTAAEFESHMAEMEKARSPRAKRKLDERDAQKTKKERSRNSVDGQTRSTAINIRTTPAIKAMLEKGSADLKMTQTQLVEEAIAAFIKQSKGKVAV